MKIRVQHKHGTTALKNDTCLTSSTTSSENSTSKDARIIMWLISSLM